MSSSLERLAMENEVKNAPGMFVRRRVVICTVVFVVTALVVVALLAHYLTPCKCDTRAATDAHEGSSTAPASPTPKPQVDVRLPTWLRPLHYQLRLQPFLNNFTFYGRVVIQIQCEQNTDVVTLHSLDLTLFNESIELVGDGNSKSALTFYEYQQDRQFLRFHFDKTLVAKRIYNLTLEFTGVLNDNLVGLYRSKYDNGKWMATTQFQPTDARRAFPCFDEPGMKAKFSVSLVRPKELMSISNMPQKNKETLDKDWEIDVYETTEKMSTYLLAFIVTNFSRSESKSSSGVDFRVFSRHDALSQTEFAAGIGPRILDFFEHFFNVSYPLPKQDMIAIPDFGAGAMENWGLITFRETALLYDPKISSVSNKERVAVVVAHELSHQWFGNLVTPAWWDDLWLNEGFAAYMEDYSLDILFKEWKMMEKFSSRLHSVLEDDSLKSSHPVSVPVHNPDQIGEIFDSISYVKGASIIRMMVNFLGNDVFRNGLQSYFNEKKFSNAVQNDLWRHMTQAAKVNGTDIDVKKIMDTWTVQTGYPVVTVARNPQEQSLTLTQRRFLLIPDNSKEGTDSQPKWEIPITFTTEKKPDFDSTLPVKWMHNSPSEKSITFNQGEGVPPSNEWIIFNVQQTGYYRVNYDNDNWANIIKQLNDIHTKIHVMNRAQLIDDAFNLARAGQLDYKIALELVGYLAKEEEYVPWKTAAVALSYIDSMLSRTPAYGKWKSYVGVKLVKPQYDSIGFDNALSSGEDADHIKQLRKTLMVLKACHFDLEECIKGCVSLFADWMGNGTNISPDLRDVVLCKAVERGGLKEWNFVWDKMITSNVGSEKESFLRSLGCTLEPWLLSKLLNMILKPEGNVRFQDSVTIASSAAKNKVGRYLLMDYVKDKFLELQKMYSGAFIFPKLVKLSMLNLNTPFELQQVKDFNSKNGNNLGGAERTMTQLIEETESNVMWMAKNYEEIESWLDAQQ